jgi:hypothetical protein
LDWILSFFVSLDDQIARISRMKASIFFVIRAPVGTEVLLQANSAKERDDQAMRQVDARGAES